MKLEKTSIFQACSLVTKVLMWGSGLSNTYFKISGQLYRENRELGQIKNARVLELGNEQYWANWKYRAFRKAWKTRPNLKFHWRNNQHQCFEKQLLLKVIVSHGESMYSVWKISRFWWVSEKWKNKKKDHIFQYLHIDQLATYLVTSFSSHCYIGATWIPRWYSGWEIWTNSSNSKSS